jgi:hypothetical protein
MRLTDYFRMQTNHRNLQEKTDTAFSLLLFTEGTQPSGFFLKKNPLRTPMQWQHLK